MTRIHVLIAAYLVAVIVANVTTALLIASWPAVVIVNAILWIGCDLVLRDALHEAWEQRGLWRRMALLIATGSILSALVNLTALPVALASCAAFLVAGAGDALVFARLRRYSWLARVNGSNVAGAILDSIVFLCCLAALGVLPWSLVPVLAAGQSVAKMAGGAVWSIVLSVGAFKRLSAKRGRL